MDERALPYTQSVGDGRHGQDRRQVCAKMETASLRRAQDEEPFVCKRLPGPAEISADYEEHNCNKAVTKSAGFRCGQEKQVPQDP